MLPGDCCTNITNAASGNTYLATNVQSSLQITLLDIATIDSNIVSNVTNIATNTTNIATNVTNIAARLPLAGGTMTGDIVFNSGQTIAGYTPRTGATGSAQSASWYGMHNVTGSPSAGFIRFNTDPVTQFEGYGSAWGATWASVGGGATGGGSDTWAVEHDNTITQLRTQLVLVKMLSVLDR